MRKFFAPILIMIVGLAWLLNVLKVLPGVNWIWTLGLAAVGIVLLAVEKINKVNFVAGTFLIVASIFSIMRQTGHLNADIEVPLLTIVLGFLIFLSLAVRLPVPRWYDTGRGAPPATTGHSGKEQQK